MTERERNIFIRGIYTGLKLAEEFGPGIEKDKSSVPSVKRTRKGGSRKPWTPEETQLLYTSMKSGEIARQIGRTSAAVTFQRYKLGIKAGSEEKPNYDGLAKLGQLENDK